MPRPRTGSIEPFRRADGSTYYRARIRLADGSRERVDVPEKYSTPAGGKSARERAELYAEALQEREDETGELYERRKARLAQESSGETCNAWHVKYMTACQAAGLATVKDKRGRWRKWIAPHIGGKDPRRLTRDDVENVRDAIDAAIRAYHEHGRGTERLAPKSGANVWGELTVSLREMFSSKRRELRVLDVDLTAGVQPPETSGGERLKCYPYPSEALLVAACEAVPRDWRETHVVAVYTYARPGELRVLEWPDVDLEGQQIRITKAWDYQNERVKKTKTHENRTIPIHANLLPLLQRMRDRADGKGHVVPLLSKVDDQQGLADVMREHFELAGCSQGRLERFKLDTSAELPLRFRSWRDAGCTWAIVDGLDVVKVQRRAGHKMIATTMKYVVEAENKSAAFGVPFPPLPASLIGSGPGADDPSVASSGAVRATNGPSRRGGPKTPGKLVRTEGLEDEPIVLSPRTHVDPRANELPRVDVSARPPVDVGPSEAGAASTRSGSPPTVEDALALALERASDDRRWDVVVQLAEELRARRLAAADVVHLDAERARRGR